MKAKEQKLYDDFIKALDIHDMRADLNPFVLKCMKITEEYAKEKAWEAWKAGVACYAGLYQIDIKDFEKWLEENQ